jgi:hypothetical protein
LCEVKEREFAMAQDDGPPVFQPPAPPSRRLGDVPWQTFGFVLFLIVTFAVMLGLILFYYVVVRVLGTP